MRMSVEKEALFRGKRRTPSPLLHLSCSQKVCVSRFLLRFGRKKRGEKREGESFRNSCETSLGSHEREGRPIPKKRGQAEIRPTEGSSGRIPEMRKRVGKRGKDEPRFQTSVNLSQQQGKRKRGV